MKTKLAVLSAMAVLAGLVITHLPNAHAATTVDYFSGRFDCTGIMNVDVYNATSTTKTAKVTFRHDNGSIKSPTSGDGTLTVGTDAVSSTTYDCSGSADGNLQIRTTSTRVIPSAELTLANGPRTLIPTAAWRTIVQK